MADVYKARDIRHERDVAVKLFRAVGTGAELVRESFRRESDALRELRHPNIVELIAADLNPDSGECFLALQWINQNLEEWLATTTSDDPHEWGWDAFADRVGLPIAHALDFAHQRDCIHRDIKPLNILMTPDGVPKVADFGIAKLKRLLDPGFTLAQFMSEPYAPPDHDHGEFSETRDVFSFAVLAVRCLTGQKPRTHAEVRTLLEDQLAAPPEAIALLRRCLHPAIDQRPRSGGVLLAELSSLQADRAYARGRQAVCYLQLTNRARERAQALFGVVGPTELASLLTDDLNELCSLRPFTESLEKGGNTVPHHYQLLGSALSLHVTVDDRTGSHLVVLGLSRPHSATLERQRERAWTPACSFLVGTPASRQEGADVIAKLEAGVRDFDDRMTEAGEDADVEELAVRWAKVLKAKRAIEQSRFEPLEFSTIDRDSTRIRFELVGHLDSPPTAELWRVDDSFFRGELDAFDRQSITLYHPAASTFNVPYAGVLRVDTQAAEEPLRRQERALEDVRTGKSLRSDIGNILAQPAGLQHPASQEVADFLIADLDAPKQTAVRAALGAPDLLVVKGPPGTGKTSFIAEAILQERRLNPHIRILLTSQTHIAIDNAIERLIDHDKDVPVIRWASDPDKVLQPIRQFLVENRVAPWVATVTERGEQYIQTWGANRGLDPDAVRRAMLLRRVLSARQRARELGAKLNEAERVLRGESVAGEHDVADDITADEAAASVSMYRDALARAQVTRRRAEDDVRNIGERDAKVLKEPEQDIAALANELVPKNEAGEQLQHLLALQEQFVQRLENPRDLLDVLLADHDVVAATCVGLGGIAGFRELEFDLCIVDEASKATATEVVIPLSRSRRAILVGDERQLPPFHGDLLDDRETMERFDLTAPEVEETVFGRISAHAPSEAVVELDLQHRMTRPIGDMVSEVFYGGRLRSARDEVLPYVTEAFGQALSWHSTSHRSDRRETEDGTSYVNGSEIHVVLDGLRRLQKSRHTMEFPCKVLVLTGYLPHCVQLQEAVRGIEPELPDLRIEVNTVDAAQGRDAEVALFSVVRSNDRRDPGFLSRAERINVAMSRGRDALCIVGDYTFCRGLDDANPMRRIADYFATTRSDAFVSTQEARA